MIAFSSMLYVPVFEQPVWLPAVCPIANDGHSVSHVDRGTVGLIKHTTLVELEQRKRGIVQ